MARHYKGDIKGAFWFSVQSSDDALYFGGGWCRGKKYMEHRFDMEHLQNVRKRIEKCKNALGQALPKLNDFFGKHEAYDVQDIERETGIRRENIRNLLAWYARLELGTKIEKCLNKRGKCKFKAEL